jgi:hypothetical protein
MHAGTKIHTVAENLVVDCRKPDFVAVGFPSVVYAPNHNISWHLQNSEPSNHQASALLNKTNRIRIDCAYCFCKGE